MTPNAPLIEEPATPVSNPSSTVQAPAAADTGGVMGWAIGAALLAIAGGALLWWLRRRRPVEASDDAIAPAAVVPAAAPPSPTAMPLPTGAPAPAMLDAVPVASVDRGRVTLTLNPRRAGLNLLSATVEAELVVRNEGATAASTIRVGAALIGAAPGQGSEVAPLFTRPVGRPATPPFSLAPGEERLVRLVVALPRAEIVPLTAGGRAMFVPVVAVNALYDAGGVEGQSARAFAIGVERVDSAKLAPFWLDQPARMHEQLAVRPYGTAVER